MENLITILRKALKKNINSTAVIDSLGEYSFDDLYNKAQTIASMLVQKNMIKSPVAVFLPKSFNAISAFTGTVLAGNFYVPLDVKAPPNRIKSIIKNLEDPFVITDEKHIQTLINIGVGSNKIININSLTYVDIIDFEAKLSKIENTIIDTDPVYIIFTSGSTGKPKGVIIPHRGVIDYINWATITFNITQKEHIGNQAPFYFDNSTLDIYLCLFTGATLNIIPDGLFMFPIKLVEYINLHKINFVFWVPSVLQAVANFDVFKTLKPNSLKKVLFAGEVMPTKHLNYWINYLPNGLFANLYGPTEITVDCTYYIVDRAFSDNEPLPIGIACKNTDILVLNNNNELVKQGKQGELCVRGSSLALGYWNNPEKTDEVFTQNPLNTKYPEKIYRTGDIVYYNKRSEIIFVGRKDNQIKLSGYRIELGEIENAAMQVSEIKNACIIFDEINKKLLLVYSSNNEVPQGEIRKQMLNFVPKYMLPSQINYVTELPLNANGKVDRKGLKKKYIDA